MIRTRQGEATDLIFTVLSGGSPVTGLTGEAFTTRLYLNGATDAETVTITELASGDYRARFTPDAAGHWHLVVRYTAGSQEWNEDVQAGYEPEAHVNVIAAQGSTSAYVLGHLTRDGKRSTNTASATITIYDIDGVSVGSKALDLDALGMFTGIITLSEAIVDNRPYLAQTVISEGGETLTVNQGLLSVSDGT